MGMNLGQMKQEVLDRVGGQASADTALVRKITALLNGSNRTIAVKKDWRWLEASTSVAITSATINITLPDACRSVFAVTVASTGTPLPYREESLWQIDNGDLATIGRGMPVEWTIVGGYMRTMPYSGGSDTLYIDYYQNVVNMVLDTDEPLLPDNHRQFLIEDTMAKLAAGDGFDRSIASMAWTLRNELLRGIMHTGRGKAAPIAPRFSRLRKGIHGGGLF